MGAARRTRGKSSRGRKGREEESGLCPKQAKAHSTAGKRQRLKPLLLFRPPIVSSSRLQVRANQMGPCSWPCPLSGRAGERKRTGGGRATRCSSFFAFAARSIRPSPLVASPMTEHWFRPLRSRARLTLLSLLHSLITNKQETQDFTVTKKDEPWRGKCFFFGWRDGEGG